MKIEIIKVEKGEFELITTNEPLPMYRRYGPDHYEHQLGVHGWHRLIDASIYEDAFKLWMRNAKSTAVTE